MFYMTALYLPLLFSGLALSISFFSFLYFKSYLKRRTAQQRILSDMREEVNNILKSINETTDRDISLIEEREKKLQSLLEEIEKRFAVYVREMESRQNADETYAAIMKKNVTYEELGKKRFRPEPEPEPQETKQAAEAAPAFPLLQFSVKSEDEPSKEEQILSLKREGYSAQQIASRLGISIDEVKIAAFILERREAE